MTLKRSWGRLEHRNRSALLILELCGIREKGVWGVDTALREASVSVPKLAIMKLEDWCDTGTQMLYSVLERLCCNVCAVTHRSTKYVHPAG